MKTHSILALAVLVGGHLLLSAAPSNPVPLWPKTPPKDAAILGEEQDTTNEKSGLVANRRVIRLGNVSQPTLTFYPAPPDRNTGASVLVCPGGGYHILAMDLEGTEVAEWLNSIGVNAILLKYRVPARPGRERWEAPLEDAQRAMGLARSKAAEWNIDPKRIGVMGFSAGAHLSAVLASKYGQRHYEPVDPADQQNCKPDFVILIYPAYLTVPKENDKIAPELVINQDTPPTFLVQTQDDGIRVECSVFYYLALKQAKVPVEMHLYPKGGHGYGLRPSEVAVTTWPKRAEEWLRAGGWLNKQ